MNSDFGAPNPASRDLDHMQTTAPSRSSGSRGGFTLILLLFAFAGGIVATLWALPAAKRWWNGDETVASADNAAQALLSEDTEDGKTQQTAPPPSSMEVAALEARLAAVSARLDAISTQADGAGGNAARAEGLLIAFATRRALDRARQLLDEYQEPKLDTATDEALRDYIARREREIPAVDALNTEY